MKEKRIRKGLRIFGTAVLAAGLLLICCGWGKKEGTADKKEALGRYAEREIGLSEPGYTEAYLMADGSYTLGGEGKDVQIVSADGAGETVNGLWRKNANMNTEMKRAVSPSGEMLLACLPVRSASEYETMSDDELLEYTYLYISSRGERKLLKPSGEAYTAGTNLEYFAFSPSGRLYASTENGAVFSMDTESGALQFLFQANDEITEFGFIGTTLIGLDTAHAWLYDLESNTLQKPNEVLDEFVASHQAGGKPIVLCSGGEEEAILYLGCQTGLYQYIWGGSMIEQIAEGQFLSLGNSYYSPVALQKLENGNFLAFFTPGRLVELYYDETLPSEPERTLTVYSLEEDSRIRYAAQLFQKEHPEVLVQYDTGMDGDNAVSREDALKNLNTRFLAGEAPDILVLDGMDIEQYAKKGVLKKLDTLLQPYLEENLLYENIVEGMRMTEDEGVYALPLMVWIPMWLGERSYLEGENGLEDLAAAFEQARAEHPQGALLPVRSEEDLLMKLIFTSLPAWIDEDGTLAQDKVAEYFSAAKQMWELNSEGMTEAEWDLMRKYYANQEVLDMQRIYSLGDLSWNDDRIWMDMGITTDVNRLYMSMNEILIYNGDYGLGKEIDAWFGSLQGQAQNVFWGSSIVGICEKAAEPELAAGFYELLLSDELMNKWWVKRGFPISRGACEWVLDAGNNEYEQYMGFAERDQFWITEEEQQMFLEIMEDASVFYQPGTVLEEAAVETGVRVCRGELTPEEGAAEVASRMAISMEE